MPLSIIKRVWDYSTYNKAFFILILILFIILNTYPEYFSDWSIITKSICIYISTILISGYGMSITKDRMNKGKRLPKIMVFDVLILGIKSTFVSLVYLIVQAFILELISSPLNFPSFNLLEMLLQFPHTIQLLYFHNPINTVIFVVLGAVLFYITVFFMEIALAKLADTGNIFEAFNLISIKKSIDVIGWRHYAKEYTLIILAIVIFLSIKNVDFQVNIVNHVWDVFLDLLAFITQYMGIGAVYSRFKEKQSDD